MITRHLNPRHPKTSPNHHQNHQLRNSRIHHQLRNNRIHHRLRSSKPQQ